MNPLDLTPSIEARSDQINADDLVAGPATYTIREVTKGIADAPFDFKLVETERCYRPNKTMRRVIVNAWGPDAATYAGRRLTLYREPTIKFGGQEVGGIRISHMSHIEGVVDLMAQTTRGKREKFTVQPLAAAPAPAPPAEGDAFTTKAALASMSAQAKGELYDRTGLPRATKLGDVKARLAEAAKELGLEHSEEPDPQAILGAYRTRDRERLGADAVEAFQRYADTGEDLDAGDQATLDAEALA